jgi:hypothetical protein
MSGCMLFFFCFMWRDLLSFNQRTHSSSNSKAYNFYIRVAVILLYRGMFLLLIMFAEIRALLLELSACSQSTYTLQYILPVDNTLQ